MSDTPKIEPALTDEEWRNGYSSVDIETQPTRVSLDGSSRFHITVKRTPLGGLAGDPRDFPALIALANAALPDTDPRKITRRMVETLMGEDGGWVSVDYTRKIAAALASYLPPESM